MSARFAVMAVPALLVALASVRDSAAQTPSARPSAAASVPAERTGKRLADVAWISGRWVDDTGGHYSEEVWLGPGGGQMVGMWRLVEWGKVQLFGLMAFGGYVVLARREAADRRAARAPPVTSVLTR